MVLVILLESRELDEILMTLWRRISHGHAEV